MKKKVQELHVGQLVKERVTELKWSTASLAKELNLSRTAVHKIYDRESLATDLLQRISVVLNKNFFLDIAKHIAGSDSIDSNLVNEVSEDYQPSKYRRQKVMIEFENGNITNLSRVNNSDTDVSTHVLQLEKQIAELTKAVGTRSSRMHRNT